MDKSERYAAASLVIAMVVVGVAWWYFAHGQGDGKLFRVREDPTFAAALRDFNTVVIRLRYPFTDMSGPGAAVTYAVQVFVFARKRVILQNVEGNECTRVEYVPTGEDIPERNTATVPAVECEAESMAYPTIEIRQAPESMVVQKGLLTVVKGRPEHVPLMVRHVILKAYPGADRVIAYTRKVLSSVS